MAPKIPEFQHTPLEAIPAIVDRVRKSFLAGKTRPVEFRLVQLRKLYWGIKDNTDLIIEACKRDLGKSAFETYLSEAGWVMNDLIFMQNNLEKWVKDESPPDIPLMNKGLKPRIRKDPLGTTLVIGAYNFPFQLSIGPLIGAISAGCTAILKPSESAPHAAAVMQLIVSKYLDPSCYQVIQGAIPETTALLDEKWDKIFYTGGEKVGTIIAKKAAETLTPVTLELGGRNPAIVTKSADPRLAARRLLWAKVHNAGQVCVSQNWILVDKEVLPAFIKELERALKEFFPNGVRASEDYARIVNLRQFQRLKGMLDNTRGRILIGGTMDESDLFLEPTVVQVNDVDDPLVVEESFGPLMPVYAVNDLDEAIRLANSIHDTPLGVYPFGNKKDTDKVLANVRSGGASVNDGFFHASIPTLPFGGVGTSGTGAYRGRASFEVFTHRRSITTTPGWLESMLSIRYPPYHGKLARFKRMQDLAPNFDRAGNRKAGLFGWLLRLGAGSAGGALARYILVALLAVGYNKYQARQAKL